MEYFLNLHCSHVARKRDQLIYSISKLMFNVSQAVHLKHTKRPGLANMTQNDHIFFAMTSKFDQSFVDGGNIDHEYL